ncbi:GNAT family N-acetyltransferase [Mesorhizobium sp. SP-1A]|uniref:GNAT family N-acetyltransferase n=1 Tax=Mesorhizobium sp. SP-1A TaxID=3077840 RepID=UPI0028F6EAF4|nr:GNAT family N-acetyltransferase [Mesorhizobium sp. SP-1A]
MSRIEISFDPAHLDFDRTSDLIKSSYWGQERTDTLNRRAFANSICAIALIEGRQVGFARASGDRAVFARISDVIVWPEHRGKGVGKALMGALLGHPDLATVGSWTLSTSDAHGLYKQFGFVAADSGLDMQMRR